jgi:excisionase family DNA binding protein
MPEPTPLSRGFEVGPLEVLRRLDRPHLFGGHGRVDQAADGGEIRDQVCGQPPVPEDQAVRVLAHDHHRDGLLELDRLAVAKSASISQRCFTETPWHNRERQRDYERQRANWSAFLKFSRRRTAVKTKVPVVGGRALKVKEAAVIVGVSARTIWSEISRGAITTTVVGRRGRRILESDLMEYLNERRK